MELSHNCKKIDDSGLFLRGSAVAQKGGENRTEKPKNQFFKTKGVKKVWLVIESFLIADCIHC